MEGLTVIIPVPSGDPPQAFVYQNQFAPVPVIPPEMEISEESPGHTAIGFEIAAIAAVDKVFTVTVVLTHVVGAPQIPSALTKNVVLTDGVTVIAEPFPRIVPPQEAEYQNQFAPDPKNPPETDNIEDTPGQTEEGVEADDKAGIEKLFTIINLLKQNVVLQIPSTLMK